MNRRSILLLSLILGLAVWVSDAAFNRLFFHDRPFLDVLILRIPGHEIYVRLITLLAFAAFGVVVSAHVEKRRRAEERTRHLNDVLRAIGNINRLIAREDDRQRLIEGVCRELVESRPYSAAWIALVGSDGAFEAAAQAGLDERFDEMLARMREGRFPRCWSSTMAADGPVLVDRASADCGDCALASVTVEEPGIHMRLGRDDRVYGMLAVRLPARMAVDAEEQGLIRELAGGLGLTFHALESVKERQGSQRELVASRSRLATTLNSIGDAVISVDAAGRVDFMNPVARQLAGWDDDALGRPAAEVFRIVDAKTGLPAENPVDRVMRDGVVADLAEHALLISRDGSTRRIADGASPIRGEDGRIAGVVLAFRDITGEYLQHEALAASEERYHRLFTSMSEGCALHEIICDDAGVPVNCRFLEINPAFERLTGLKRDEVVGRTILDVLPGTEKSWIETYGKVALTGESVRFERYHEQLDHHYEVTTYSPRRGLFAVIFSDVTDRVRREKEIREQNRVSQTLLDSLPCVALLLRPRTREIVASNAAARRAGALPGTRCYKTFRRRESPCPWCLAPEVWRGDGPCHLEVEVAGTFWDACWHPISDDLYLHYAFDITDRRHLEEQFRQAQKMEAVGHLAGGVAHDFRNQLMVIKGYCDVLRSGLPEGPMRESVDQIAAAAGRAADVTRQLLAFGRRQVLQPEPLDLDEVVASLRSPLSRMLGEDVRIHMRAGARQATVKADRSAIEQAIINLVINARDAMPRGGDLTLETSDATVGPSSDARFAELSPGRYVALSVVDTGTGMDDATRERIFEPFFSTKEVGRGTGLGLSMVYGFVKQSGGCINVESVPGRGSTFTLYLPWSPEGPAARAPEPLLAEMPAGTEKLLVVEDEDTVRQLIVRVLEDCGYAVAEAASGREALSLAGDERDPVRLLVTDVVMPEMGGVELVERLRAVRPDLKVLYISGYAESAASVGALDRPGTALLKKPFGPGALARAVRRMLDGDAHAR